MRRRVTLSSLLSATFDEIGASRQVIGIYLAIMIPLGTAATWVEGPQTDRLFGFDFGFEITESLLALGFLAVMLVLAAFVVGIVMQYWLCAAMVRHTVAPGFRRLLPYVGIYILSSLGMIFGLLLLIVPGIILAIRWLVALPLVAGTQTPALDTLGESWELTRGYGWSIFGAAIVLFIGLFVVAGIVGGVSVLFGGQGGLGAMAVSTLVEQVYAIVLIAFGVAAYRLLHDDTGELAQVFE